MRHLAIFFIALLLFVNSHAATDTVVVYSNSMFKDVRCVVVTPTSYPSTNDRFPVVYLLHGYSGNYSDWIKKEPRLQQLADENRVMIVCPDGGSWYFDSPVDFTKRYETHVALEIPAYIDANYRTVANRTGRAIAGLSMGGHGALFLAARHRDVFGACSSMSGGLDVSKIKSGFDIPKALGDTVVNLSYYNDWSVINVLEKLKDSMALLIDCGVSDMFYDMNKRTHQRLMSLNIPHTYIEREGGHSWEYWLNALPYHLLFFRQYFDRKQR
jgi:S-formylglutathione hydrolase FrmB